MEIKKKYLSKYLNDIAIEQIAEDYIKNGYKVSKGEKLGNFRADLIARKASEQIVIEVKSGKMSLDRKKELAGLADYINHLGGYKFIVVVATPPKEKKLEINGIEQLISNYVHNELPDELDELSSNTIPDEVADIDIDEITVSGNSIFVKGGGVVTVELQFGSEKDNNEGFKTYDNFPFDFDMTLEYNSNNKLEIKKVNKFKIDTSSYYSIES